MHVKMLSTYHCVLIMHVNLRVPSDEVEYVDMDWDNLGFSLKPADYMYAMKCAKDGAFEKGEIRPYGNIEMSPAAGVLNYGQVS